MKHSGFQIVLLVLALLVANCQCVTSCASEGDRAMSALGQSSSDSTPPCHQHNPSTPNQPPDRCTHSSVVAEEQAPLVSSPLFVQMVPVVFAQEQTALFVPSEHDEQEIRETIVPPTPDLVLTTVLRV